MVPLRKGISWILRILRLIDQCTTDINTQRYIVDVSSEVREENIGIPRVSNASTGRIGFPEVVRVSGNHTLNIIGSRMRLTKTIYLLLIGYCQASQWLFSKGKAQVGDTVLPFDSNKPFASLDLATDQSLKLIFTISKDAEQSKPHQAFVLLKHGESALESFFVASVTENGNAKVDISYKDIPSPLLSTEAPLDVSLVIGSFGSERPLLTTIGSIRAAHDGSISPPLQYQALPEIRHLFKTETRMPPKVLSYTTTILVLAQLFLLLQLWMRLGANLSALNTALEAAPLSHCIFFGCLIAYEILYYAYYTRLNLFQVLPIAAVLGLTTSLSGMKALSEVQNRRLRGER